MLTLFKFRNPDQLNFLFDIIYSKRVYCADWRAVNDPMEGLFSYTFSGPERERHRSKLDEIVREKERYRICSFSQTISEPLLWAHYAGGFKGFAVEIQIQNPSIHFKEVTYSDKPLIVDGDLVIDQDMAKEALTRKRQFWHYEDEIRLLHRGTYFDLPVGSVKRIHGGIAVEDAIEKAVADCAMKLNLDYSRTTIDQQNRLHAGSTRTD